MTTIQPSKFKIGLLIATTVFFWSSALVAIRIGLKAYDPGSLALFRYLIASAGMLLMYVLFSKKRKIPWRDVPKLFIAGVVGFGVYNVALNYGEVTVSAGVAGFIVGQIPVAVAILSVIFLGERLSLVACFGMVVSIIGVTLIFISSAKGASSGIGVVYLLIATITAGVYSTSYKYLVKKYNAIELTAFGMWSGTVVLLVYWSHLWQEIPMADAAATLAAIYLGIFPGVIAYICWCHVLKYIPASKAGGAIYMMPIIAAILGWLCLGEVPAWLALVGGVIALIGAIIVVRAGHVASRPVVPAMAKGALEQSPPLSKGG